MTATTAHDLRRVALEQFAANGYLATSLNGIAGAAGVSKASVLYHYASKEQLLEAALAPAIDGLELIVARLEEIGRRTPDGIEDDPAARRDFLTQFVEFLLAHRLAVHVFVNQQAALIDVPIMMRADSLIQRIARHFEHNAGGVEEKMRFGIALAGAAYLLSQAGFWKDEPLPPSEEMGPVLTRVLVELIEGR